MRRLDFITPGPRGYRGVRHAGSTCALRIWENNTLSNEEKTGNSNKESAVGKKKGRGPDWARMVSAPGPVRPRSHSGQGCRLAGRGRHDRQARRPLGRNGVGGMGRQRGLRQPAGARNPARAAPMAVITDDPGGGGRRSVPGGRGGGDAAAPPAAGVARGERRPRRAAKQAHHRQHDTECLVKRFSVHPERPFYC